MVLARQFNPLLRAILVIGSVMVLVTGITFAFTSTASLTGNTISSVTANLLVNNGDDDVFSESETGFAFENLNAGEYSDPAEEFALQNNGDTALDVNVQVTGESALPAGVDGDDITFKFLVPDTDADLDTDPDVVEATWAEIIAAPGVNLLQDFAAASEADISVAVMIDESVTAESVDIAPFNFTFTGTSDSEVIEE